MTTEAAKAKTADALRDLVAWCEKHGACITDRDGSRIRIVIGDDSILADGVYRSGGPNYFLRQSLEEVEL